MLVIVGGRPATGKTTICRSLARRIDAVHLRIDTVEQAIVGSGAAEHPIGAVGYEVGYALAADHLRQGLTVVADSVNPLPVTRDAWLAVGAAAGTAVVEIEIVCSDAGEHRRRASVRTSDIPGLPLPGWEAITARDYRPWGGDHVVCDTAGRTVGDCVTELERAIRRHGDSPVRDAGRLPLERQLSLLRDMLVRNDILAELLERVAPLGLPGWYLAAGCVSQTVWNVVTGRPAADGIKDYDLVYFDGADLSEAAERAAGDRVRHVLSGLACPVDVRNQARVHLWYEAKHGVPCPPYTSTENAIDTFPATAGCLGVRLDADGAWRTYAPYGLSDVFNLVVRPNPVLAPRGVYASKAARWRQRWPELTVLPWNDWKPI